MPTTLLPSPHDGRSRPLDAGDGRRGQNAAAVLRAVLDQGPVARSTIGRVTGLSGAAVSRQLADLADLRLVRERPIRAPRPAVGRPHVPVDLDVRHHVAAGVHIAVLHSTLVLMDLRGRVLAEERVPLGPDRSPRTALADLATRTAAFLDAHGAGRRPLGVGVATGGWVDPARGVVVRHRGLDWRDVPVGPLLGERLGLPVSVDGHARALAHAEQLFGDERERARSSLVHLFVGNVVDAAIATGGSVHEGPNAAAGHVSHLPVGGEAPCSCGRRGCLAATAGERAVAGRAVVAGRLQTLRFADVLAALEADERWALDLLRDRARVVGRAAALLLDVINPEVLVVCEAGTARRPELLADLRAEVARHSHRGGEAARRVVAGSFGTQALGVAAGSVVLRETYERPLELAARI